ncbi:hypothetical protein [Escherichia coli]|uniref:hypothetical protein n=1 Tax=Escherichia coli TaxID=562 RepID=UPI0019235783|nr:hypothetical protein [Escherichia coli]
MKSTSDLFNEIIPLGRLIHMVNQKKDRLLNEYLSPLDITAAQFKVLCSIRCAACISEQCHQLVGQDLHQELTKNLTADEVATLEHLLKKVLP